MVVYRSHKQALPKCFDRETGEQLLAAVHFCTSEYVWDEHSPSKETPFALQCHCVTWNMCSECQCRTQRKRNWAPSLHPLCVSRNRYRQCQPLVVVMATVSCVCCAWTGSATRRSSTAVPVTWRAAWCALDNYTTSETRVLCAVNPSMLSLSSSLPNRIRNSGAHCRVAKINLSIDPPPPPTLDLIQGAGEFLVPIYIYVLSNGLFCPAGIRV